MNSYTVEFNTINNDYRKVYFVIANNFSSAITTAKKEHSEYIRQGCFSKEERKKLKAMIINAVFLEKEETINWSNEKVYMSINENQKYLLINKLNKEVEHLSNQLDNTLMTWRDASKKEKELKEIQAMLKQIL